jgi:gliding motility-associated-like protein
VLEEIEPPATIVSLGADQEIQLPSNEVEIVALAESERLIESYTWSQVGGDAVTFTSEDNTLTLSGLSSGTYAFRLTVVDELGNEAFDEITIIVKEPFVKPFNVFSPNNDNPENDQWTIQNAEQLDGCDVVVYNRQGQKVFQSKGYPIPWDGNLNGKQLPEGVYFYVIRCSGKESLNGSVTLIR